MARGYGYALRVTQLPPVPPVSSEATEPFSPMPGIPKDDSDADALVTTEVTLPSLPSSAPPAFADASWVSSRIGQTPCSRRAWSR